MHKDTQGQIRGHRMAPGLLMLVAALSLATSASAQTFFGFSQSQELAPALAPQAETVYSISGHVRTAAGAPVPDVTLVAVDYFTEEQTGQATTDADGFYEITTIPQGWMGIVTPSREGFAFDPAVREYGALFSNQEDQDYIAEGDLPVDPTPTPPSPTPTPTPPSPTPTATPSATPDLDTDGDGKPDHCESLAPGPGQTHLLLPDTDADGLLDGQEDPGDCEGMLTEPLAMTNPRNPDTDGNGIMDGVEVLLLETNPLDPDDPADATDSSGDGLPDYYVIELGQDPENPDWDGNRFTNGYELLMGSDPLDPDSKPALGDVSGDGTTNNVDAIQLFNLFLGNVPSVARMDLADVRADGQINNVDAVVLFNWILGTMPFIPLR